MPAGRGIAAELAADWANLNIGPEDLLAFLEKAKEYGNRGDVVSMFGVIDRLIERTRFAAEAKTLLELAKCYFLIDDEPIEAQTLHHDALKEEAWKKDGASRAFFLRESFVLTKGYSAFSGTDILAYLRAQEYIAMRTPSDTPRSAGPKTAKDQSPTSFMTGVKRLTRRPS